MSAQCPVCPKPDITGQFVSTPVVPARCQEEGQSSRSSIVITHRVQSDDHQVQTNLAAAKATTHAIRNRNIETAKLACFLNSLRPSLIRVVRREKIERTKRKIGIAAATNAMILKNIFHRRPCYSEGNSFVRCLPRQRRLHNRFVRWARRGIWENLFRELARNGRSTDTQMNLVGKSGQLRWQFWAERLESQKINRP